MELRMQERWERADETKGTKYTFLKIEFLFDPETLHFCEV